MIKMEKQALKDSSMGYQPRFHCHTRGYFAFPCQRAADSNGNVIFEECATPREVRKTSFMSNKDWQKSNKVWCYENCGKFQLPGHHKEFSIDITYLSSEEEFEDYFKLRPLNLMFHDLEQHPETLGILESHIKSEKVCEALRQYKTAKKTFEENGVRVEELEVELNC